MKRATTLWISLILLLVIAEASGGEPPRNFGQGILNNQSLDQVNLMAFQTDILLPDVILVEPQRSPHATQNGEIRLRAMVQSRIPLIGVTVRWNKENFRRIKIDGDRIYSLDMLISLRPGENFIEIIGVNDKGSSKPSTAIVVYQPVPQSKPNLAVLAIGISKSRWSRCFKSADGDAEAFAKVMSSQTVENGLFAGVTTEVLINERATREAILEKLKWLRYQRKTANDVSILFLSGCLATNYIDNSVYFLTSQHEPELDLAFANIRYNEFWEYLGSSEGPTVIFANTIWAERGEKFFLERLTMYSKKDGLNSYFSSADGFLFPSYLKSEHSVFTTALLDGLNGKADLEIPGEGKDRIIDTHELQTWIRWAVENFTEGRQQPAIQVGLKRVPIFKLAPAN